MKIIKNQTSRIHFIASHLRDYDDYVSTNKISRIYLRKHKNCIHIYIN